MLRVFPTSVQAHTVIGKAATPGDRDSLILVVEAKVID